MTRGKKIVTAGVFQGQLSRVVMELSASGLREHKLHCLEQTAFRGRFGLDSIQRSLSNK